MMKKTIVCLLSFIPLLINGMNSQEFLRNITSNVYDPKGIGTIVPMIDGEHYAKITENGKQILAYSYKKGIIRDTIFDVEKIKKCPIDSIEGFMLDSLEQRVLLYTNSEPIYRHSKVADYYVYNRRRQTFDALSDGGKQRDAIFSPNGRLVAFARSNNLFIKKLDFNTEVAITSNGKVGEIINGTADWNYEEEFGETRLFEWSPDSKMLAFVRLDETNVPSLSFQWFAGEKLAKNGYPVLETFKYSRAGESISKASLHIYDVFYKSTKIVDVGSESDFYLPKIAWGLTSDVLFAFRMNHIQNQLDMFVINSRSTVGKITLSERSENYYIDYKNLQAFCPLVNNRMIWMSEMDGYRHLYLYDWQNGKKIQQITSGKWDVTKFYGFDSKKELAYYQSATPSAINRSIYLSDLKGRMKCLTAKEGTHEAQFNTAFSYFIDTYSSAQQPTIVSVFGVSGIEIRTIEDNAQLQSEAKKLDLSEKIFFDFKTPNGDRLNGWLIKPTNFDESKKYPVLMVQYGGPNSQMVRNSWELGWEQFLVKNGFVVACVDGRGTGARGEYFRKCTYQNLGEKEVVDQINAAKYLATMPFVDANRIGIWGWSYGGFITLACMTSGENIFKAGIAVAPVTDWKLYDSAYTERFMRRPQENFMGYEANSLLKKAKDLQGNLLIVHGTSDDNVHLQNTMQFVEAMINAGVQFDMMLYPNKNHSILGNETRFHLYTKFSEFLFKNL